MRSFLLVLAATLLIGAAVLPNLRPPAPVLAKDNAETLRQLEADFLKATSERGSEGYLSYYAEDAVEVPDGAHVLQGKESIARTMGFLDDKTNSPGRPSVQTSRPQVTSATPTAPMSFGRQAKMANLPSPTASTPPSGRSRAMASGRSSSIWATAALKRNLLSGG
jgi:hypothetical protein